jgi:hypothetical protein
MLLVFRNSKRFLPADLSGTVSMGTPRVYTGATLERSYGNSFRAFLIALIAEEIVYNYYANLCLLKRRDRCSFTQAIRCKGKMLFTANFIL